jgi:hypothetical protein
MKLIILKTFDNTIDAHLLCSKLENEGIKTFIFDENIVSLNPLFNNLIGGIKVKIAEQDLDQATKILSEMEASSLTGEDNTVITCPKCNSQMISTGVKTMKGLTGILAFLLALFFMVLPFYSTVKKCKDCGFEFK